MIGIETNPRLNAPPEAISFVASSPKKATATGIAIEPPSTTSANSFVDEVASPDRYNIIIRF